MNHLALAELAIRLERETAHARHAMAELARAKPHQRRKGERLAAIAWRRAKRHLRRAAVTRAQLAALIGGAS